MAQDATAILGELKKGVYRPVYFLQGDESFYIDAISDFIEENALDEMQKGFNQIILYGRDVDVNAILLNARRFPMMSERQVVIVKEAQEVKDLNKEQGSKQLLEYLKNPQPSTILVFAHKNKTLDGRKALGKQMGKLAVLVTSKALYVNQVPDWVNKYLQEKGYKITPKAVAMLVESVGTSLSKLSNELQKVFINFEQGTEINDDHVSKYVGISKDYNVFELQKALTNRDVLKANRIVHQFSLNPKDNPLIPIIALLYSYFTKVLLAHGSQDKSDRGLASALGVNPYFVKDYKLAMTNYKLMSAMHIISHIREADLFAKGIKGGSQTDGDVLKELVFKILHS